MTNGDVERALAMVRPTPTMRDYDGKSFPSRRALSLYLAAKFGGKWPTWNKRLQLTKDDVTAAVRKTLRGSGSGRRISKSARDEGA